MYALIDCNNFYCSCERVFNPSLNGRPVIVLSNNDGCAVSRSDEAKAIGIEMGVPAFMIRELIERHNVAVFSSNYTLYGDMSDRVMQVLSTFCSRMEIFSIDEAFLDLHNMPYTDLPTLGMDIRRTVKQHTGIPVTVGIAATKTLAKMANRYAKKKYKDIGVFWAATDRLVDQMLQETPVGDICGVGPQYARFLKRSGFETAADFVRAPDAWVKENMSVVGQRLLYELRGTPAIQMEYEAPAKKNIACARGFGYLITGKEEIAEAVSNYAANCALKLRQQRSACREISVFVQTNPHRTELPQYMRSVIIEMEVPTNGTADIIRASIRGLDMIYKPGFKYLKAGVTLSEFVPESAIQQSLFTRTNEKTAALMKAFDQVNSQIGKEVVRMASQGFERNYKLKAERLSPRYTTRMSDILKVN